jgi:aldose 1-epimerase
MTIAETIKTSKHHHHSKADELVRSVRLINFESGEVATIMPNLGATVLELVLRSDKKLHSILEAPGSLREIIANEHYHGSKLIPFPGRIPDGKYHFAGKTFNLKRNSRDRASSMHGFVCKMPFRIVRTSVNNRRATVVLQFIHNGETKGYPFKFSVRLTYTLSRSSFTCATLIRNLDRRSIPVGDGWHPYYRTSSKIGRLRMTLPPHAVVELSQEKIPTGRIMPPTRMAVTFPLSQKKLDSVFDLGEKRRIVITTLADPRKRLELRLWQEAGAGKYRYLVVYRPASGTSVAVEPWTCAPNAANNNLGLIVLKPRGTFRASYGVTLRASR